MTLLDARVIRVVYEMNLYAAVPSIPMLVIVVELNLDFVVVLWCPGLAQLSENLFDKSTEKPSERNRRKRIKTNKQTNIKIYIHWFYFIVSTL